MPRLRLPLLWLSTATVLLAAAPGVFPGRTWTVAPRPEDAGFATEGVAAARAYAATIPTAAVMIVRDGIVAAQWGEVAKKYNTHSIRKSFLSALYGAPVRSGLIKLDATVGELGIDDVAGLSAEEKQATVRDLLKARSGVYHPALYESAGMKKLKPPRFSERAGTHWYYNNWDFNVAGTLYERATGRGIFEAIAEEIARPIGMEDYTPADGNYERGPESEHAAYPFRVTARDLARFGLLLLHRGEWNGRRVLAADWIDESTRYHSDATLYSTDGYGYMWWVVRHHNKFPHYPGVALPEGAFSARGSGGHHVVIIPVDRLVIVHRVDTDQAGRRVTDAQFGELLRLILAARL